LGAVALALSCAAVATAASLTISPLRIDLDQRTRSGILTVANAADQPVNVVVGGYRWEQTGDAPQTLGDAPELAVYPKSFTLAPHESRPIRVALLQSAGTSERAYRILITELLPPNSATDGVMLRVQEQLSIPAFSAAQTPTIALHVVGARVGDRGVTFAVRNDGSKHAFIGRADVELLDAHATVLARVGVDGWYVLAGAVQRYGTTIAAGVCARVATLRLHIHSEAGGDVVSTIAPERACASDS
jgi:fimbrial chaperone protein